ncbi:MAG: hypothetical protein IKJ17_00670 [Clostridia bacterium]|nr:hypothetical protein [Clostridia bacterium]
MKKLLALLLAGIMIFALVGCNNAEVSEEADNSGYSEELDEAEDVVNKINMTYGDDETKITLYKPEGASFSVDAEDAKDAGDIVIMLADDYSWDAEIMGYKHFEGISSNEPFVEYYFDGAASDNYTFYEQEMADLGIEYEGKPVKLIRYIYKEVDDEEEYKECFVGFEYKGTEDSGLFGLKITPSDEELSDDYIKDLFTQIFAS